MITHILFASDLTLSSHGVFQHVLDLAVSCSAKVTLFHAFDLTNPAMSSLFDRPFNPELNDIELKMDNQAQTHLGVFSEQLESAGIKSEIAISRGPAGPMIVETAEKLSCDLIIKGTRGLSAFKSALLGSTSNYILHHSSCAVMIIK